MNRTGRPPQARNLSLASDCSSPASSTSSGPSVGFAAVKLLEDAGCKVVVPGQTCCGQPAYNAGDRESAKRLARQAIAAFEDCDYVVAPSGSCGGMLIKHYPELFAGEPDLAQSGPSFSLKKRTS